MENQAVSGTKKPLFGGRKPLFTQKELLLLTGPLLVEQLLEVTVGMADTMMVSRCGEAAISGVSLVDMINNLIIVLFAALATGGAVVVSQYLGAKEQKHANASSGQLILLSALLGVGVGVFCFVLARPMLRLCYGSIEADVLDAGVLYLKIIALSYPFLALYNGGAALYRSMGNSKISMQISILMNIINIGGNAFLVYVCGWGAAGVGTATLISRAVSAIVILRLIGNHHNVVYVADLQKVHFEWPMIRSILRIGIPSGVENSLFNIGKLIVQGFLAGLGTAAIAANAISGSIANFLLVPGGAISLGLITVVGQCIGAGEYDQARYYVRRLMLFVYACNIVLNATLLLILRPLVGLFALSDAAKAIVFQLLPVYAAFQVTLWPLAFPFPNVLRAAGDTRYTMIVSMISMWTLRVGLCYVFVNLLHLGVPGIWYAMYCDWVGRSVCFLLRYRSGKWREKRVIQ